MTSKETNNRYLNLTNGRQLLESSLHKNLIEYLNVEISLKTITTEDEALQWLRHTFLYVRIQANPNYYASEFGRGDLDWKERIEGILRDAISTLADRELVHKNGTQIQGAELGTIMSQSFIRYETFIRYLDAFPFQSLEATLLEICNSKELKDVTLRGGERQFYTSLCKLDGIRFPLKKVTSGVEKAYVIIQAILGGVTIPKHQSISPLLEASRILSSAVRLSKTMFGLSIFRRHTSMALWSGEIYRSTQSHCWESSTMVFRQIPSIGQKVSVGILYE